MGKAYDAIDERLAGFIARQKLFFVATAPAGPDGHVNVSPKGLETFAVLGPNAVAYLDLTGSGIETVAHLRENGRITIMFCAFEGPPKILRLYGRGEAIEPGHADFDELRARFPAFEGVRGVVRVAVDRIQDACGYAVPLMTYERDRDQLGRWAASRGAEGLVAYRAEKNRVSIDGLPGLENSFHTRPTASGLKSVSTS